MQPRYSRDTAEIQPRLREHVLSEDEAPLLSDLRKGGFTAADCRVAGILPNECREAGYTFAELAPSFSIETCLSCGFTHNEIAQCWPFEPYEAYVRAMKVAELRVALEKRKLGTEGVKATLVARMLQADRVPKRTHAQMEVAGSSIRSHLQAEEVQQDLQAATLSEEVLALREKLKAEKRARINAEAAVAARLDQGGQAASVAQASRRAQDAALRREAAATALTLSQGTSNLERFDAEDFLARFMAFRQHVETLLEYLPSKTARSKPWKISLRRSVLCGDVLLLFSSGRGAASFNKTKLFQQTNVTFFDAHGNEEAGDDQGGLTVEMYSSFFREVLLPENGLFESVSDTGDATTSIGLLPAPSATPEALRAVGRAICKCVLDDQPLGRGIGHFVFEYLSDAHERRVFKTPDRALAALADYDPELSQRWEQLLREPQAGLSLDLFDPAADDCAELPATCHAMATAISAGCRHRLLGCREQSLRALREGFTELVDLRIQLGALGSNELMRMMRGNTALSAEELLACFQWPDTHASAHVEEQAGFAAVGSKVPAFLREIILDECFESGLSTDQRLHLLEWATALTALPCSGLKDPITLKLYAEADENDLPNVHTCTHEVHLPAYRSRAQLREKLLKAVEHRHDGFQIERLLKVHRQNGNAAPLNRPDLALSSILGIRKLHTTRTVAHQSTPPAGRIRRPCTVSVPIERVPMECMEVRRHARASVCRAYQV